jgi:hypothetical protein
MDILATLTAKLVTLKQTYSRLSDETVLTNALQTLSWSL